MSGALWTVGLVVRSSPVTLLTASCKGKRTKKQRRDAGPKPYQVGAQGKAPTQVVSRTELPDERTEKSQKKGGAHPP